MKRIAVVGAGYVGLSIALLLDKPHQVIVYDFSTKKVGQLKAKRSPFQDPLVQKYLDDATLSFTTDPDTALSDAEIVIVATPTDYNNEDFQFDTSSIEQVVQLVKSVNQDATIVIKSTVPVGYTQSLNLEFECNNILFSPEFLREGSSLQDSLFPSRIIVGDLGEEGASVAELFASACLQKQPTIQLMPSSEAEAVKLFSNTYLAMRVAFFNELDTFAEQTGLDSRKIISGVGEDPRIGNHYNNPSFGYGGYCLPKDTKQLLSNYRGVPNDLIQAIVKSNTTRKDFIVESVLELSPETVGVYRLIMKSDSDNFRSSSMVGIIERLLAKGVSLVLYEPLLTESLWSNVKLVSDLDVFKQKADVILANRSSEELADVCDKVYSRDLFGNG
ncbi:nucleotide sugar dehydrogenase [Vibrio paucivorans]